MTLVSDEAVERAAMAVEKATLQAQYGWTDEEFEIWWNKNPDFVSRRHVWGFFKGTRKERALWEARIALEAALS